MKKYPTILIAIAAILTVTFSLTACSTVKPYQRVYLNDDAMRPGRPGIAKFEENAHAIREGASGAGNGKTSGGCGCN
jgi:hypothetical protein